MQLVAAGVKHGSCVMQALRTLCAKMMADLGFSFEPNIHSEVAWIVCKFDDMGCDVIRCWNFSEYERCSPSFYSECKMVSYS